MKIINRTKYDTNDLRKISNLCMSKFRADEKGNSLLKSNYKVVFETHKASGGWVGGCAYYNSSWFTIKLPLEYKRTHLTFEQSIADVWFHEIGHCLGVRHNKRHSSIEEPYQEWIKKTITSDYAVKEKVKLKRDKGDIIVKRFNAVVKNLEVAKTRFKRAKTLLRKWESKLKYYQSSQLLAAKLKDKQ
jgi:hypothetical protein